MGLAEKLALGLAANLDGDKFYTAKEDKKSSKQKEIKTIPVNEHQLVFSLEKRRGKPVTIIGKFYVDENIKKELLKLLKSKLACGGSIKDENIEIQGDIKEKIRTIMLDKGWQFKN